MLKTAMIFGNNMVLQQQKNIRIWGTGMPGKTITGSLKGKELIVTEVNVGIDGDWVIIFPPQEAGRGLELILTDDTDTLIFHNISIGEVWLAGGQSNMEFFLEWDADKMDVLEGPMNSDICFFDYPRVSYEGQLEEHDYSRFGIWRKCSREDLPYFSAAGYYFARYLNEKLDIPIGIVGCNWGGTTASSWIDRNYLKDNEGKAWLDSYEEAVKDLDLEAYKEAFRQNPMNDYSNPLRPVEGLLGRICSPGLTREEQIEFISTAMTEHENTTMSQVGPYYERRPGGLYEMMLRKIAPYSIRGVIWYQGESDEEKSELYSTVFTKMIECWRRLWDDQLPFIFVQLAPFGEWLGITGQRYPEVRKQQEVVSKTVRDTWMVSSSDAGMEWDIHPKNKRPIGTRLAMSAMGHVYGENILCDPPEFSSAERVPEGIRIIFQYGDGLYVKGDKVNALVITSTEGKELAPVQVIVVDDGLLIVGDIPEKVTISFAKTAYYEVNLYNKADNPAKPFEVII